MMDMSIITYDLTSAEVNQLSEVDELLKYKNKSKTSWININGLSDIAAIKRLCELYEIHYLTIEDVLNTKQQAKTEMFDDYTFLSVKTIQQEKNFRHPKKGQGKRRGFWKRKEEEIDEFLIDQVSIIIMRNVLITFQEISGDSFDSIRKRITSNKGGIRKMGTEYLAYAIIDAIVDEYFHSLNHLEEDIENLEERATKTSDDAFIGEIQDTKKYLLQIRRAISPLRDNVSTINRQEKIFHTSKLKPFMQDLNDHLNETMTMVDHHREWLSNIMDVNLSVLSHQMNKVMKILAIISAIFIPLTLITGIYGMNFEHMPELEHPFAYPIVLGSIGLIAITMLVIFKVRRWF
jgi:magnesium transporter